jgi:hypothetical protein
VRVDDVVGPSSGEECGVAENCLSGRLGRRRSRCEPARDPKGQVGANRENGVPSSDRWDGDISTKRGTSPAKVSRAQSLPSRDDGDCSPSGACRPPGPPMAGIRVEDWVMSGALSSAMGLGDLSAMEATDESEMAPRAGINRPGFVDNSDGANLRSAPAESGGSMLRSGPLRERPAQGEPRPRTRGGHRQLSAARSTRRWRRQRPARGWSSHLVGEPGVCAEPGE